MVPIIIPLSSLCFIASIYILHFLYIICIPLKHVQEVFLGGCSEKKKYMYSTSYWSEVNRNIIKPQFYFLHHQEEKALKRLVEVEI